MLIGAPFACLIRPFHSRQLRYFTYTLLLSKSPTLIATPHQHSSPFPFAITLTNNSLQCSLLSVFLSTLDFFSPLLSGVSRSAVSQRSRTFKQLMTHATIERPFSKSQVNAFTVENREITRDLVNTARFIYFLERYKRKWVSC